MRKRLTTYWRFLSGLRKYLNEPISYETARDAILCRMEQRNEQLLAHGEALRLREPSSLSPSVARGALRIRHMASVLPA